MTLSPVRRSSQPFDLAIAGGIECSLQFDVQASAPTPPRFIGHSTWMSRMGSRPKRWDPRLHQLDDARHGGFGIVRLHEIEVAVHAGRTEIGDRALVDAMGAGDDAALCRLPEHFGEAHHWHRAGCDDIRQHLAGPTEGSWSMSPTIKRAALSGIAFMSACISMTSTMEASSTTSRSQSSGLSSPRLKPPPLGSTSRSRWMVLASNPVASVMRLAARPVGAQQKPPPLAARMRRIALDDGGLADTGTAGHDQHLGHEREPDRGYLLSARIIPMRFSTHGNALSGSIQGQGSAVRSRVSRSAMVRSARCRPARNTQGVSPTGRQ